MSDTRDRLIASALSTVVAEGLGGASARAIAARAGVNQALIFYHFGTVSELVEAASDVAVEAAAASYREAFAEASSLADLVRIGRHVHERERGNGNVAFMAQLLSGAQHDPVIARATRRAMAVWTGEVERVLRRVLGDGPVAELLDVEGLASVVTAGFVGLELSAGVDEAAAARALTTMESISRLVGVVDDLGPVARRALRTAARRRA